MILSHGLGWLTISSIQEIFLQDNMQIWIFFLIFLSRYLHELYFKFFLNSTDRFCESSRTDEFFWQKNVGGVDCRQMLPVIRSLFSLKLILSALWNTVFKPESRHLITPYSSLHTHIVMFMLCYISVNWDLCDEFRKYWMQLFRMMSVWCIIMYNIDVIIA